MGARQGPDGSRRQVLDPAGLKAQVHENLTHLGVDALDVVNLRLGAHDTPTEDSLADQFGALAELRQQGLIRHLGLSAVSARQLAEARTIAPVVTAQNLYNPAHRQDGTLLDLRAARNIALVPCFPLGGFTPLQSETLTKVAARLGTSPQQVAPAWLLQRSPAVALIPGTSSVTHLRENVASAGLTLPADAIEELDWIGRAT